MYIIYWIVTSFTAFVFLVAGVMKLIRQKDSLQVLGMAWADDFSVTQVKLIGTAEALGALGLMLPIATGIAEFLSPLAAIALGLLMIGAVSVHIRRKEPLVPLAFLLLAATSAVLGILIVF